MNPQEFNEEKHPPQFPGPGARQQYKFTEEELRVLKECNRESFYKRCIPIASVLGFSTYYGVKAGYLRPNSRWGAVPKVGVAVLVGYFLGKFSYQSKCAEKLMALPNSKIGEVLRQRRQGSWRESLEPGYGAGMSLGPFNSISSSDTYSDIAPSNGLDIDTTRPDYGGLDDSHRPSLDNPIYEEEMPPIQKNVTTYDELRKQNREEYQQKRIGVYKEPTPKSATPFTSSPKHHEDGPIHRNQYGDVIE